jgi:hypothetical protein
MRNKRGERSRRGRDVCGGAERRAIKRVPPSSLPLAGQREVILTRILLHDCGRAPTADDADSDRV